MNTMIWSMMLLNFFQDFYRLVNRILNSTQLENLPSMRREEELERIANQEVDMKYSIRNTRYPIFQMLILF